MRFLLVALVVCSWLSPSSAEDANDNLFRDAAEILSRPDGTVRKWESDVDVAILGDEFFSASVDAKLREISLSTNVQFTSLQISTPVEELIRDGLLKANSAPGGGGRSVQFQIGDLSAVFDTVIVGGSRADVTSAALALSPSRASMQFAFLLSRNEINCHFESLSRPNGIFVSLVFIPTDQAQDEIDGCIHTELLHSMGLRNELNRESNFSFSANSIISADSKEYDFDLLSSLYSGFQSGAAARDVAAAFMEFTQARQ